MKNVFQINDATTVFLLLLCYFCSFYFLLFYFPLLLMWQCFDLSLYYFVVDILLKENLVV